jgi:hypothetical protein
LSEGRRRCALPAWSGVSSASSWRKAIRRSRAQVHGQGLVDAGFGAELADLGGEVVALLQTLGEHFGFPAGRGLGGDGLGSRGGHLLDELGKGWGWLGHDGQGLFEQSGFAAG